MNGLIAIIPFIFNNAVFFCATGRLRTQCVEIIHGKGTETSESELLSLCSRVSEVTLTRVSVLKEARRASKSLEQKPKIVTFSNLNFTGSPNLP